VQQAHRIVTMATVLCVTLVNAGVLHAVHMRQHCSHGGASDASCHGGKDRSRNHHDPATCSLCIQFAFGKAVSPQSGEHVIATASPAEEVVSLPTIVLPSVFLSSLVVRGPPSVSL
jgi:hypothetical protein